MINNVLRRYGPMERYKGRQQLRVILDNIDDRFNSYGYKLNHNGGAIIDMNSSIPMYSREYSPGFIMIKYDSESESRLSFRFMKGYNIQYTLNMLHKIRKRLLNVYEFNKKNFLDVSMINIQ